MKRILLKKLFIVGITFVSTGAAVGVSAVESMKDIPVVSKEANRNMIDNSVIKNGDFTSGLDHWIVSNPESNNPELITENGVSYVKATYGENIHQYVNLNPNKTYTFSYTAAGSAAFPAKVEFGTLNHGEAFVVLQESAHNNENWERHEFTFTTPEVDHIYSIRFSSTGNGWGKFKNIDVQPEEEPTLLSVGVRDNLPVIYLTLGKEQFYSEQRYVVHLNGKYHFETYNGEPYYAIVETENDIVRARGSFTGKKGDKIEVYTKEGRPGVVSNNDQLLETFIVEEDLM